MAAALVMHVCLHGRIHKFPNTDAEADAESTHDDADLVTRLAPNAFQADDDKETTVTLFTCSRNVLPKWATLDKKTSKCVLHISTDLNANGIALRHVAEALLVIFRVRTTFSNARSYMTFRIICHHQRLTVPETIDKYPITDDESEFMFVNSQRLPPDIRDITRTSKFVSQFIRNPYGLPHPLVCMIPVLPQVSLESVNESSPLQTVSELVRTWAGKVFDIDYRQATFQTIFPTIFVEGVTPLYVWKPEAGGKRIVIASMHPSGRRELDSTADIKIYQVHALQYMVRTTQEFDIFLILLPPAAISELLDFDSGISHVKGMDKSYIARVPVREWLYMIGKIPTRTLCNTFLYAVCGDVAKLKVVPKLTIQPADNPSVEMLCGYITSVGNTTAKMRLLNSQQTCEIKMITGMQTGMCGCFVSIAVGTADTQVKLERFDEIPDPEPYEAHTVWDPTITAPIYTRPPARLPVKGKKTGAASTAAVAAAVDTETSEPIATVTRRGCSCYICEQLLQKDGTYRLVDVEVADVLAALCTDGARTPFQELLAFMFHVQTTFSEVKTPPPQQILTTLLNAPSDYVNLRVYGLAPSPQVQALASDTWEKSTVARDGITASPDVVLIGNRAPIVAVYDTKVLQNTPMRSNGYSWFLDTPLKGGLRPLVMVIAKSTDIQRFVKMLSSSERQYIHNGSRFVHSTAACNISTTFVVPTFSDRMGRELFDAGKTQLPEMPVIERSERVFYDFCFTGVIHFLAGTKYTVFCANA